MRISKDEVIHVANLARIELAPESVNKFSAQLGDILDYIDKLNQVNTEGITGTTHSTSLCNAFREDELGGGHLDRSEALSNAPEQEEGAFVVPKVIG